MVLYSIRSGHLLLLQSCTVATARINNFLSDTWAATYPREQLYFNSSKETDTQDEEEKKHRIKDSQENGYRTVLCTNRKPNKNTTDKQTEVEEQTKGTTVQSSIKTKAGAPVVGKQTKRQPKQRINK